MSELRKRAMAVVRSKSDSGISEVRTPNPFWSSRAALEWELQKARPEHLPEVRDLPPVPGSDGEEERCEEEPGRGRSRSRPGGESRQHSEGLVFATPASWEATGQSGNEIRGKGGSRLGPRTEGPMRMEEEETYEKNGLKEREKIAKGRSSSELDELQRSLEEEMVFRLHEENMKLKAEVKRLQEIEGQQSASSWSEVSPGEADRREVPPPPPGVKGWDEIRYTPNGTRIPSGPPPTAEDCEELWKRLPRWPLESYDHEKGHQPCGARLGMAEVRMRDQDRRAENALSHGGAQGGMDSRQERSHLFQGCGGGNQSRQEHQVQVDVSGARGDCRATDVMSAAQAKAVWLERELASLQQLLHDQHSSQGMGGSYWTKPVGRWSGEVLHHGRDCGDRASLHHGQDCGDRASLHHGQGCGDRASLQHGRDCGDRASLQHGRDCGDRASLQHGRDCGDQALLHRGRDCGDQIFQQLGRAGGNQFFANGKDWQGDRGNLGRQGGHGDRTFAGHGEEREVRETTSRGEGVGDEAMRDEKDHLKAVNISLPMLPSHTGKESGLACGDWLVQVRPLIGDIMSGGALQWWDDVLRTVTEQYNRWLLADPLQRLHLPPPADVEYNTSALRKRLDIRTSTLLLAALPSTLKSELVSARQMATGEILYRIMRNYQPGAWQRNRKLSKHCQ